MSRDDAITLLSLAVIIFLVVFGPFITIWSLNTLFALHVGYTFWTWLASAWLVFVITNPRLNKK